MRIDVQMSSTARVAADVRGHRVVTDQPEKAGGADEGPAPFDLFLASIATCAGFYAQRFCQARDLDPAGLRLGLVAERNAETKRLDRLELDLELPEDFPGKYRKALVRAIDQCAVKKVILDPPEIEVVLRDRIVEPV